MSRIPGGEKNKKSGKKWSEDELREVYYLYKKLNGEGLHERNPLIKEIAKRLGRTVRSTEAQTLMYRNLDRGGEYSHGNMNKLCRKIWLEEEGDYILKETVNTANLDFKDTKKNQQMLYPSALLDWAGSGSGGVKKPFDVNSGRPTGEHIQTSLTYKIDNWIKEIPNHSPRIILLVGGPGNGKTDSLEYLVQEFDKEFKTDYFIEIAHNNRDAGITPPRSITVDLNIKDLPYKRLKVVQDATPGEGNVSSEQSLINDFEEAINENMLYIACINRGILADTIRLAEKNNTEIYKILKTVITGLTDYLDPKSLWPLTIKGKLKDQIGVWPMDVESLVEANDKFKSPAEKIFQAALNKDKWKCKVCTVNKDYCPFYQNRKNLSKTENLDGLLRVLRDFELISNKRWTFRDLYALIPYLIVGSRKEFANQDPCKWVDRNIKVLNKPMVDQRIKTVWKLSDHLYHAKLYSKWPSFHSFVRSKKNRDINQILHHSEYASALLGYFSYNRSMNVNKPVIGSFLDDHFFPLINPSQLSNINDDFNKLFENVKKIESYFSYSVRAGYDQIKEYLNPLENELFNQLIEVERELDEKVREINSSNSQIDRFLSIVRIIAIRYFKRVYFTSKGLSKDEIYLREYRQLNPQIDKSKQQLKEAKNLFDSLIQGKDDLSLVLNSSISQPSLSIDSQVKLIVGRVTLDHEYVINDVDDVPRNNIAVFKIVFATKDIPVPLTYQLYKALAQLKEGVRASSLPTEVLAMLDNIKSRLTGITVRGGLNILRNAKIQIGDSSFYYRVDDPRKEFEITKQTYE
ncbi:hypothetical protein C7S20_16750 [Christiangramia fulva]|uniref:Uncharacterized protein n=1 Tax=Christiangramia fulva TaxID=2126553 RepID=A0A2R3Z922_9FLAO|nr:hypothetical protein [Christiangramia fulva]AVR46778.1 hypothetical protein C7S20_16750 [Christiangramia fulva]